MSCTFGASAINEGAVRSEIRNALINKKVTACPIAMRLAWHASGTFDKTSKTGGSNGATMRFAPESTDGANAGLSIVQDLLLPIREKHPEVSFADIWAYAGCVSIEETGGPKIPFKFGRTDSDGKDVPPNGRLPDASKGAAHLREVFYRMGFDDKEIVILSGGHTLGRCHKTRSGFDGPWTPDPLLFNNDYYKKLLESTWEERKWDGPKQYQDKETGKLMMLPTDLALIQDEKFRPYVEKYAKSQEEFFKDFAAAFSKLIHLGVPEPKEQPLTDKQKASAEFRDHCMHGSTERAKALASKADVHEAEPGSSRTALHKAVFWGHEEITRFLVQDLRLDVNAQDYEGDTALMEAAKFGHDKVAKTLLDGGAKKDLKNKAGKTALDLATQHGKAEIVKMLQ